MHWMSQFGLAIMIIIIIIIVYEYNPMQTLFVLFEASDAAQSYDLGFRNPFPLRLLDNIIPSRWRYYPFAPIQL